MDEDPNGGQGGILRRSVYYIRNTAQRLAGKEGGTLLPSHQSGGPKGLGDPNDRTLRRVEEDVTVPKLMKERAKVEKCADVVEAFGKCAKDRTYKMPWQCRKEANNLRICLENAYSDPVFIKDVEEDYFARRTKYRETGQTRHFDRKKDRQTLDVKAINNNEKRS